MSDDNYSRNSFNIEEIIREVRKEVEDKGEILKKYLALVDSFSDIIPGEAKRYAAALKAMSKASSLELDDILASADERLLEVENQEKRFVDIVGAWRRDISNMSDRAEDIKKELSELRERLARLETEEREAKDLLSGGEKKIRAAVSIFDSTMRDIRKDVGSLKKKIALCLTEEEEEEEPPKVDKPERPEKVEAGGNSRDTVEEEEEEEIEEEEPETVEEREEYRPPKKKKKASSGRGMPDEYGESDFEDELPGFAGTSPLGLPDSVSDEGGEPKSETKSSGKRCPVCNSDMDFYTAENKWKCFVCAHEE